MVKKQDVQIIERGIDEIRIQRVSMPTQLDITGSGLVEISIRHDGKVIWINTAENG